MATIIKKDSKISIPDSEIIAVTATTQMGRPAVRVICKQFDYYGREVVFRQ